MHCRTLLRQKESKQRIHEMKYIMVSIEGKEKDLTKEIDDLTNSIADITRQIESEKIKRKDAITDSIPIVGQVWGIIGGLTTKRYTRMIPFYSGVTGLFSWFTQQKEMLERNLEYKRRELADLLKRKSEKSGQVQKEELNLIFIDQEVDRFEGQKSKLEAETKELGKRITDLRNVQMSFQGLLTKYKFLSKDVDLITDFVSSDLFEDELITNLIADVTKTQQLFLAIKL